VTYRNENGMICTRETDASRRALTVAVGVIAIEMRRDPIDGRLSRCSRHVLVYSSDHDAVSSASVARVRGAAAHD
jgi:hypothetical protein